MQSKIFDCHVHIDKEHHPGYTEIGLDDYWCTTYKKNYIVNHLDRYDMYRKYSIRQNCTLTCIFDFRDNKNIDTFIKRYNSKEIVAGKIHSKIQCIKTGDYNLLGNRLKLIPVTIPIIIDAWYDWSCIELLPNLQHIINLAESEPERKFIIAHSGGYKILEYFFHTRKIQNIYYDLSLTLNYMKGTSVWKDVKHFLRWIPSNRLMFGSDYPYSPPDTQLKNLNKLMLKLKYTQVDKDLVLYQTANNIFR